MKTKAIVLTILLAVAAGWFAHWQFSTQKVDATADSAPHDEAISIPSLQSEAVVKRYMVVVVDGPDIYVGKDRVLHEHLKPFLAKYAELNRLRAMMVIGSISASYRDVVFVISSVDRKQIPSVTISTRPYPSGYRLDPIQTDDWYEDSL